MMGVMNGHLGAVMALAPGNGLCATGYARRAQRQVCKATFSIVLPICYCSAFSQLEEIPMHALIRLLPLLGAISIASAQAEAPAYVTTRALTPALAQQGVMAALQDCATRGYQVAVALVGRDGRLLAFARDPLAGPHTIDVAKGKAYTSTTFRSSTTSLMGREFMRDIPGVLVIGGGLPIQAAGHFYGGIGVSGAPAQKTPGDVDELCAQAGISAITDTLELAGD
jgi:uncharacterized protein GlcG (DUF336 family)